MVSQMLFLLISVVAINSGLGYADDDFQSHAVYPELGAQPHATDSESSPSKGFALRHVFYHGLQDPESSTNFLSMSTESVNVLQFDGQGKLTPPDTMPVRSRALLHSRRTSAGSSNDVIDRDVPLESSILADENLWTTEEVLGPDVSDKVTVVNLAKMTSNAYVLDPSQPDWLNTTVGFNSSHGFGWKGDGLRGHVFADQTNETVIVSFKGTSIDPRDKWRGNDRLNDNLLFSCCCASQRPDPFWYGQVCDCCTDTYRCNSTCLTNELYQKDRYYPTALAVTEKISSWYPNASLWVVGHSMGGALASLVGLTLGIPAVTFEAPPEKLPAERLGLTIPPRTATFHVGNTADPVFMGACNSYFSTCAATGYAFESQCFTGKRCVYDTVSDKGWHLSIANHRINTVIKDVLEAYEEVPVCETDAECVDCYNWRFVTEKSETKPGR